jgi:hypothetical protein
MTLASGVPVENDAAFLALLMGCGHGENGLTEFLAGLLRTPSILSAFLHDVLRLDVPDDVLRMVTVTSEDEAASKKGVPDTSIRSGDHLFVLVENKLGAPFTDNQPHEYVRSLAAWKAARPAGSAVLVVQGPEARMSALRNETWRLLEQRLPGLSRTASAYGGVELRFISWWDTQRALTSVTVEHPVVSYLLKSFLHVLPIVVESTSRIVTEECLMKLNDKTVLEAIAAAEDVLSDVGRMLRERYEVKTDSNELDFTYSGFTVYPRLPDRTRDERRGFSVSLSARFGAHFGLSPLSVSLAPGYERIDALKQAGWRVVPGSELARFEWFPWPTVPLNLQAGLEPIRQAEHVVADIEQIRRIALGEAAT